MLSLLALVPALFAAAPTVPIPASEAFVARFAAFLVTFGVLRLITTILHYDLWPNGPFPYVITKGGLHIHHRLWGILLLMVTGFTALATRDPK